MASYGSSVLFFKEPLYCSPQWRHKFTFPAGEEEGSLCSHYGETRYLGYKDKQDKPHTLDYFRQGEMFFCLKTEEEKK